ncbi:hypothetical protein KUTeg_000776 [Tegillarca granosa]|uniref:Ras-related GTP-binding protein n=1 Tax=Tegillarca granosa TaxID=220873 RepID=A0ABQ9G2T7_TEGGR|nr:hypothetical protein KUTeg_000773 [Tegillarca granosa]KAJ8322305.1 hypothetical protein KUTeg_000776 [Tegillarca granosa]
MSSFNDVETPAMYGSSFPKGFGYGPEEAEGEANIPTTEHKPRILLMGLRRSGKSSIQKVVFHKVAPNETLFLESTNKIVKEGNLSIIYDSYCDKNSGIEKAFLFDVVSKIYIATDDSPVDMQSYELCCDMIDVVIDISYIYGITEDGAFDSHSSSIIKLNNGTILYLREVNRYLALVCILREDSFEKQGVIDYNFLCFRQAIQEVFEMKQKNQMVSSMSNSAEYSHSQSNGIVNG